MSQTTQIELEPKDCMFLLNYLGIKFTPQLFQPCHSKQGSVDYRAQHPQVQTVTIKNTKSKTQKVSSLYFVASFKARFGDNDIDYGLTPTYTMGISICRDALC